MADDRTDILRTEREELERIRELEKEIRRMRKESLDDDSELLTKYERRAKLNEQFIESVRREFEERGEISKELKDQIEKQTGIRVQMSLTKKEAAELVTKLEDANEQLEEQNDAFKAAEDSALSTLSSITGIQIGLGDVLENTLKTGVGMEALGSAAKKLLNPLNIGLSALSSIRTNTIAAVLEFNSGVAALNAVSGAAGELNDLVYDTAEAGRFVGVGYGEAAQAVQGLIPTVTNFRDLSKESQLELTKFASGMEALGVSAATTGQIFDTLTDGLNMFPEEAVAVQNELAKTAIALSIPPQQMAEGFAEALPYLSSFGKDAPQIFAKTAAAAKKLSVEASTLIGITEQFDTFEGAAQSAGQLNALLGGDLLNSFELLNGTTDERIRLVLQAVDASGKEFESMSRFERMALANAAGIQDMSEASKIFEGGLSAFDDAANALENVAVSQEDLEEAQRASLDTTKKLSAVMNALAVGVKPLTDIFNGFLDIILELNKNYPNAIRYTISFVAVLGTLYGVVKAIGGMRSLWMGFSAAKEAAGGAIPAIWNWIKARIFQKTVEEQLGDEMDKNNRKTSNSGKSISRTLMRIGVAGKAAGAGLIKIGFAFLLIGAGIGIAAAGLALFVYSFSFLTGEQLIAAAVGLTAFGVAMGLLIAALVGLGPVSAVAIGVLTAIGVAVAAIGIGIGAAAAGMSVLVGSINDISIAKISSLSKEIRGIGSSLKSIPETKAVAFSEVVEGMVKYSNQIDAAPENLENVEKMVQLAAQYQETQSELKVPSLDSFVEALKGLAGANRAPSAAGAGGGTEIVLKLNDREFGRAVANTLNKDLDMRVR